MIEETIRKLQHLRLFAMIEQIRQLVDTSRLGTLSADDLLAFIVDAEYDRRNNNRIARLLQQAGLKLPTACIADLQFSAKRNLRKEHLEQVMNMAFVKQQKNVLISGATGVGKTYIACAIGHIACMNGFSTKYFRVTKFLEHMAAEQQLGNYLKAIEKLGKVNLLVLDDLGPDVMTKSQRNNFLEIIEERYMKTSTIIASQLPISQWYAVFGETTSADAICDRLFHNSFKIELKGESMRKSTT
jgi:DNA replication protein DnaC